MIPDYHASTTPRRAQGVFAAALVGLALGVLVTAASAQVWTEGGDAGSLPATAQITVGTSALTTINGSLATPLDVDMYCIRVNVPSALLVALQCTVIQGPDVWLFDANGKGISANTTCVGGAKTITSAFLPTAGTYYVAVAFDGVYPYAGANPIWLTANTTERAPDGPGAAGTVTGWQGTPILQPVNPYQVLLSTVAYCSAAVPATPPTWGQMKSFYR